MASFPRGEIVIEIDHQRTISDPKLGPVCAGNSDVYFPFATNQDGSHLRSRIIPQRSGSSIKRVWLGIQSIPGQRLHVDPKSMRWRLTDGLDEPENKQILQQVKRADREANAAVRAVGGGISGGYPEQSGKLNTPAELHNWLYWMRRLVDSSHATILQGEGDLPSAQTLVNGGDIRIVGDPKIAKWETGSQFYKPAEKTEAAAV